MKQCCTGVTIPKSCNTGCDRHYDSCCVINGDNLPCLFPIATTSGTAVVNTLTITVADAEGILPGMSVIYNDLDLGQLVTGVVGTTVYVDKVNPISYSEHKIEFKRINVSQCEINAVIDYKLCACPEWIDLTPNSAGGWRNQGFGTLNAQFSKVDKCTVRLRGAFVTDSYSTAETVIGTLPLGYRPVIGHNRGFPIFSAINGNPVISGLAVEGSLGWIQFISPTVQNGDNVIVYLDGVFYEVDPN